MRSGIQIGIAGVSFHQAAVQTAQVGDDVVLVHEPDNAFDPNAVAVLTMNGVKLGHVPAALAPRFSDPAQGGSTNCAWTARISDKTRYTLRDGATGHGLQVTLEHQVAGAV